MANLIGQTLLNQFRVDKFLAAGGMGSVFLVWDLKRNVPLAMKVLHAELADDPTILKRFKREANALKRLAHPHIVPFYGLHQTDGFAFLLERFIDGPSLKEILRDRNKSPLSVRDALVYLKAVSAALGYAHASGVVHCDVKPGNVMVDQGGNIYLTDFGVARHAESSTTTFGGAGTPSYMPPEQILGEPVTPATDVYALGSMVYEMLTGQRLFRSGQAGTERSGSTIDEKIRHAQMHSPPPDPRTLNPLISEALADVILTALKKTPSERFSSAPEFCNAACEAAGLSPHQIGDRAILSNFPPESVVDSTPARVANTSTQPIASLARRFRALPTWQSIGIIVLVFSFCTLAGLGALGLPAVLSAEPTNTHTPTAITTMTPTATMVPSPTASPTRSPERFFTEDFDHPLQYWRNFVTTDNEDHLKFSVSNGVLNFRLTALELWTYLVYEPVSYEEVRLRVVVNNREENSGTILICHFNGREWYEFRILSSGLYEIAFKNFNSDNKHTSQSRISNGGSTQIKLGKSQNEYAAVCSRNELTLYVNGELINTVTPNRPDQVLVEGKIGIGVFSTQKAQPVEVDIDEVQIGQP